VFGISFSEILVIAVITLVVVGPQKLPGMLRNIGQWVARLRRLTTEVRAQTGIDEVLREEGIDGVRELRALLRGEVTAARSRAHDPYEDSIEVDELQEFPCEGADAGGALPDDLVAETPRERTVPVGELASAPQERQQPSAPTVGEGGES
jgi:Tat protein translocase TatB subunit